MVKEINDAEVGQKIREARLAAKLSQRELADETDISITQLSEYENGNRTIGLKNLYKIAVALGKTLDELYIGSINKRRLVLSKDKGELMINCFDELYKNDAIAILPMQADYDFDGAPALIYVLKFSKYEHVFKALFNDLQDFDSNKSLYDNPVAFRKELLVSAIKKINSENEK